MSRQEFEAAVSRMDAAQWEAMRVCIMAERRLRFLFPRGTAEKPALSAAYDWALAAKPDAMAQFFTAGRRA